MKVVVTLTTIPSRLETADTKHCLQSLVGQSVPNGVDYSVRFNIPWTHKFTGKVYNIPEWLDRMKQCTQHFIINRTEDQGPNTKLLPTLLQESDMNTLIIVCDDDLVQHPNMVSTHLDMRKKYPDCALGQDGMKSIKPFFNDHRDYFVNTVPHDTYVKILQAYKTISYKRSFFGQDYFDLFAQTSWNDDLLNSAYMAFKKISRVVLTSEFNPSIASQEEWTRKGGVCTFPVVRHTAHETMEGCNVYRNQKQEDNSHFFQKFLDA